MAGMTLVQFVEAYFIENQRGCPKGALQFAGGFKVADINKAIKDGILESGRGSEGGLFVAGTKPAPKGDSNGDPSLKAKLVDALRAYVAGTLLKSVAESLILDYDIECETRKAAKESKLAIVDPPVADIAPTA